MSYSSEILADSPIFWWRFKESASPYAEEMADAADFADEFGGSSSSTVLSPLINEGDARSLNTAATRLDTPAMPAMGGLNTPESIEFWIRFNNLADLVSYFELGNNNGFWIRATSTGSSTIGLFAGTGFNYTFTADDAWYHLVYTNEGDAAAKLYINGSLVGSATHSGGYNWEGLTCHINYADEAATVYIAELAVYDFVLSPERVLAHYEAATSGPPPPPPPPTDDYGELIDSHNPVLWYRLDGHKQQIRLSYP